MVRREVAITLGCIYAINECFLGFLVNNLGIVVESVLGGKHSLSNHGT